MNKPTKLALTLFAVVIIVGGIIVLLGRNTDKKADNSNTNNNSTQTNNGGGGNDAAQEDNKDVAVTIIYDGNSFKASADSMKAGQKVKVVNQSDEDLDFDSDPHPVHTDNTELNAGDIIGGGSKTFTITKKGTWGYHNHLDASQHGQITVE